MTPQDIINKVKEDAGEWLEMFSNPDQMVSGILAYHILELKSEIEYLERRLQYVSAN